MDVSVACVEYPGYGKCEGSPSEQGCIEAVITGLNELMENELVCADKITILGHQEGCSIATSAVKQLPYFSFRSLILHNPLPSFNHSLSWYSPLRYVCKGMFSLEDALPHLDLPILILISASSYELTATELFLACVNVKSKKMTIEQNERPALCFEVLMWFNYLTK
jgi:hypothetical protein